MIKIISYFEQWTVIFLMFILFKSLILDTSALKSTLLWFFVILLEDIGQFANKRTIKCEEFGN
jgi:hypothetical protein